MVKSLFFSSRNHCALLSNNSYSTVGVVILAKTKIDLHHDAEEDNKELQLKIIVILITHIQQT